MGLRERGVGEGGRAMGAVELRKVFPPRLKPPTHRTRGWESSALLSVLGATVYYFCYFVLGLTRCSLTGSVSKKPEMTKCPVVNTRLES